MSPERKLMLIVFLTGAVDDPELRQKDPTLYYRLAKLAGVSQRRAETLTYAQAVDALAEMESELTKERV